MASSSAWWHLWMHELLHILPWQHVSTIASSRSLRSLSVLCVAIITTVIVAVVVVMALSCKISAVRSMSLCLFLFSFDHCLSQCAGRGPLGQRQSLLHGGPPQAPLQAPAGQARPQALLHEEPPRTVGPADAKHPRALMNHIFM